MIDCECKAWQDSNYPINEHHVACPKHPSNRTMEKVHCLLCDKELDYEPGPDHTGCVYDGGFMLVSFHYGSRNDQCPSAMPAENDLDKMLNCDEIEAFICDDCFEKKFKKMRGYDVKRTRPVRNRIM